MPIYTDTFGANPIFAGQPLSILNLTGNETLSWPTQFQDVNGTATTIMEITQTAGGFILTLPDATFVSPGVTILIINSGVHTFILHDNAGGVLIPVVNVGSYTLLILDDNTTAAGGWKFSPFGAGGATVTSVGATSLDADLTIAGSPITGAGSFTFNFAGNVRSLSSLAPTGIVLHTAATTFATASMIGGANIAITNGAGTGGNITVALNGSLAGMTQIDVGNLRLNTNTISSTNGNGLIILSPNGTGYISSTADIRLTAGTQLRLYNAANTFYSSFHSPAGLATNAAYTLPAALPTANSQALTANIDGTTAWTSVPVGAVSGINRIVNGDFQVNQLGNTFSITNVTQYGPDQWIISSGVGTAATFTVEPIGIATKAGLSLQRDAGNAGVNIITAGQSIPIGNCIGVAGNPVTISFTALAGADFSAVAQRMTVILYTGTGLNDVNNALTPFTGLNTVGTPYIPIITALPTRYSVTYAALPTNVTQLYLQIFYTPTGVAGANDYFTITDVQVETSSASSAFEQLSYQQTLEMCYYYFQYLTGVASRCIGVGYQNSNVLSKFVANYQPMRIAPITTISAVGDFVVQAADNSLNAVGVLAFVNQTKEGTVGITTTSAAAGAGGQSCLLLTANIGAAVTFDARLK